MAKQKTDNTAMKELKSALKAGTPGQLYVFYGEETYLREYYLGELKKVLLPDGLDTFNLHTIGGKEFTPHLLAQTVDCFPMMSERTMVLVTDYDLASGGESDKEELIEIFEQLPDYCCVVFLYDLVAYKMDSRTKMANALKKYANVVNFQRQEQGDLVDWLARRFKAAGKSIGTEEARYLMFRCGDLMNNLITEVDKISAYSKAPRVTKEDIDAVAVPVVDAVVFSMTDALARGDFDKAAAVLHDLLSAQEPPLMILYMMGKHFRDLYAARLAREHGKNAAWLMEQRGIKSQWGAEKLMDSSRRFSLPWCRNAVRLCAETDIAIKTVNGSNERDLLVDLLLVLANSGRERA